MFPIVPSTYAISIALIALGISYVVTGSKIGFPIRAAWWLIWCKVPLVRRLLGKLVQCPPCNAWWSGLVTAFLTGASLWVALQCSFIACGLTAVAQGVAGLAADDEDTIAEMWTEFFNRLRGKRE
jgi:hypothetical protein